MVDEEHELIEKIKEREQKKAAARLLKRQELKKMYKDLLYFGKKCFPTAFTVKSPPFHREIAAYLTDMSKKRILIAAPRGSSKSTLTSFLYVLWKALFKSSRDDVFIVIISESRTQAINFLARIKSHLNTTREVKYYFGDMSEATAKRWRTDDIILANGSRIIAIGTGSKIRGFIEKDTRPTDIIVDDFESEKNAFTPEARLKNREWMTEAVIPSLRQHAGGGRIIVIGTVISEDCFLFWAKNSTAWHTLWYKIVDDDGNPIWADVYPLSKIKQIREEFESVGNLSGFFQEYMNEPQSPDDAPFKPHYIKTHDYRFKVKENGEKVLYKGDIEIPVNVYLGIDPASSLSRKADYFTIIPIAVDADENFYVVGEHVVHARIDPAKQPDMIIEKFLATKADRVVIETVAYQEALRSWLRRLMLEKGLYIPGIEKGERPRNSKDVRLLSLVPILASGRFYFHPNSIDMQAEFLSFPKGQHDDYLDATWYAISKARKPKKRKSSGNKFDIMRKRVSFLNWKVR